MSVPMKVITDLVTGPPVSKQQRCKLLISGKLI